MVKVGSDFYIAVRDSSNNLYYFRVSGGGSTLLTTRTMAMMAAGRFNYTLDGEGRLYATVTAANRVNVFDRDTGAIAATTVALSANVAAMLGFAERVLAKDASNNLYDITPTGGVQQITPADPTLLQHFNNCTDPTNTQAFDGIGTNFIRCMFDDGTATNGQRLSSIAFVGGQYRRPNAPLFIIDNTA